MAALAPLIAAAASAAPAIVIEEVKKSVKKAKANKTNKKNKNQKQNKNSKNRKGRKGKQTVGSSAASAGRTKFGPSNISPAMLAAFRRMCSNAIGELQQGTSVPNGAMGPVKPVTRRFRINGASVQFQFAHQAQTDTDRSFKNGIRVVVTDVDGGASTIGSTGYLLVQGPNNTVVPGTNPFANDTTTGTNTSIVRIAPSLMSNVTFLLAQVFEYYAFRYLRLRYRAETGSYGSDSATTKTNLSFAMGISTDPDSRPYTSVATSFRAIAELETHVTCHVTEDAELEYAYTGTETFSCNSSDAVDERYQAVIVGAFDQAPSLGGAATAGPIYGHIEEFIVIDLYGLRTTSTQVPAKLKVSEEEKFAPPPPATAAAASASAAPTMDAARRSQSTPRK